MNFFDRALAEAKANPPPGTSKLALVGCDVGDQTYQNDLGFWNVTKAQRDCAAGKHVLGLFDTEPLYEASKGVEFDANHAAGLSEEALGEPLIAVMFEGKAYLIDGRHRLERLRERGDAEVMAWLIAEADEPTYRITWRFE